MFNLKIKTVFIVYFQINWFIAPFLWSSLIQWMSGALFSRIVRHRTQSNPRNSVRFFFTADGQRLYCTVLWARSSSLLSIFNAQQRKYRRLALLKFIAVSLPFIFSLSLPFLWTSHTLNACKRTNRNKQTKKKKISGHVPEGTSEKHRTTVAPADKNLHRRPYTTLPIQSILMFEPNKCKLIHTHTQTHTIRTMAYHRNRLIQRYLSFFSFAFQLIIYK